MDLTDSLIQFSRYNQGTHQKSVHIYSLGTTPITTDSRKFEKESSPIVVRAINAKEQELKEEASVSISIYMGANPGSFGDYFFRCLS